MKLAQQLRKTEAELDKVQRLHLAKSRRLMELEQEVEAFHGGLESRAHEVERISLERDAAQRAREEQLHQVEQLTPTLTLTLTPTLPLTLTPTPTASRAVRLDAILARADPMMYMVAIKPRSSALF